MDASRIGLTVEELPSVPKEVRKNADKRRYFDTSRLGKSASGHDFALELDEAERTAVLEYLKTL